MRRRFVIPVCLALGVTACGGAAPAGSRAAPESEDHEDHEEREAVPPPSPRDTATAPGGAAEPPTPSPAEGAPATPEPPTTDPVPPAAAVPVAAPAPAPASGGVAPPPPQVLVTLRSLHEDLAMSARYQELLATIRREVEMRPDHLAPAVCSSGTRDQIVALVREGHSSMSSIRTYRDKLDELCGSFDRWEVPDDRILGRIQGFWARLDRIEGWMSDILQCIDPGPYDGRCENAYGPPGGTDARDAVAAQETIDEARRALERAAGGRFPCHSPVWGRIAARQWTQRVARAQMPHLPREVQRICEHIGVDDATVTERVRYIQDRVDVDQVNTRRQAATIEQRITQTRQIYGLPP